MGNPSTDDYRFERKFVVKTATRSEVEAIVRSSRAMFREIYHERTVNNLYFDSVGKGQYLAAIEGQRDREKYRLRWYGGLRSAATPGARFEVKIRRNAMNTKLVYPFDGDFDSEQPLRARDELLANQAVPRALGEKLRRLRPVLINSYRRTYYRSADGALRLTIDDEIEYLGVRSTGAVDGVRGLPTFPLVVELKYGPGADRVARETASSLPFRLARNSKYTNGIDALRGRGSLS